MGNFLKALYMHFNILVSLLSSILASTKAKGSNNMSWLDITAKLCRWIPFLYPWCWKRLNGNEDTSTPWKDVCGALPHNTLCCDTFVYRLDKVSKCMYYSHNCSQLIFFEPTALSRSSYQAKIQIETFNQSEDQRNMGAQG
jgi:hypothetical protein